MVNMLQLKIISNLLTNKEGISIKKLSENIKTYYKNVHNSVNKLFEQGLIKKEKFGNYNICKLNYKNEDIIEYLKEQNFHIKISQFRKKHPAEYQIITETIEKYLELKETPLFICILFGSYAKNEERESSDIDILLLTHFTGTRFEKTFEKILKERNIPHQKKFHITEQWIDNFIKDFKNKNKLSIATEIYKNPPIIFYGDDTFFRIITEFNKLW